MPEQNRDPRVPFSAWFLATSQRAAFLIVLSYIVVVTLAVSFLEILEAAQGYSDMRTRHVSIFFAVVVAVPYAWALRNIYRRPKLPSYPRRRLTTH
jgi:hypothetical protein